MNSVQWEHRPQRHQSMAVSGLRQDCGHLGRWVEAWSRTRILLARLASKQSVGSSSLPGRAIFKGKMTILADAEEIEAESYTLVLPFDIKFTVMCFGESKGILIWNHLQIWNSILR
jgi:hypothetical protein